MPRKHTHSINNTPALPDWEKPPGGRRGGDKLFMVFSQVRIYELKLGEKQKEMNL